MSTDQQAGSGVTILSGRITAGHREAVRLLEAVEAGVRSRYPVGPSGDLSTLASVYGKSTNAGATA